jgi:hypothetical protein
MQLYGLHGLAGCFATFAGAIAMASAPPGAPCSDPGAICECPTLMFPESEAVVTEVDDHAWVIPIVASRPGPLYPAYDAALLVEPLSPSGTARGMDPPRQQWKVSFEARQPTARLTQELEGLEPNDGALRLPVSSFPAGSYRLSLYIPGQPCCFDRITIRLLDCPNGVPTIVTPESESRRSFSGFSLTVRSGVEQRDSVTLAATDLDTSIGAQVGMDGCLRLGSGAATLKCCREQPPRGKLTHFRCKLDPPESAWPVDGAISLTAFDPVFPYCQDRVTVRAADCPPHLPTITFPESEGILTPRFATAPVDPLTGGRLHAVNVLIDAGLERGNDLRVEITELESGSESQDHAVYTPSPCTRTGELLTSGQEWYECPIAEGPSPSPPGEQRAFAVVVYSERLPMCADRIVATVAKPECPDGIPTIVAPESESVAQGAWTAGVELKTIIDRNHIPAEYLGATASVGTDVRQPCVPSRSLDTVTEVACRVPADAALPGTPIWVSAFDTRQPRCADRVMVRLPSCPEGYPVILSPESESVAPITLRDGRWLLRVRVASTASDLLRVTTSIAATETVCATTGPGADGSTHEFDCAFREPPIGVAQITAYTRPECADRVVVKAHPECPQGSPTIVFPESEGAFARSSEVLVRTRIPKAELALAWSSGAGGGPWAPCEGRPSRREGELLRFQCRVVSVSGAEHISLIAYDRRLPQCADRITLNAGPCPDGVPVIVSPASESTVQTGEQGLVRVLVRASTDTGLRASVRRAAGEYGASVAHPCGDGSVRRSGNTFEYQCSLTTCSNDGGCVDRHVIDVYFEQNPECADRVVVARNQVDQCPHGMPDIAYPESESTVGAGRHSSPNDRTVLVMVNGVQDTNYRMRVEASPLGEVPTRRRQRGECTPLGQFSALPGLAFECPVESTTAGTRYQIRAYYESDPECAEQIVVDAVPSDLCLGTLRPPVIVFPEAESTLSDRDGKTLLLLEKDPSLEWSDVEASCAADGQPWSRCRRSPWDIENRDEAWFDCQLPPDSGSDALVSFAASYSFDPYCGDRVVVRHARQDCPPDRRPVIVYPEAEGLVAADTDAQLTALGVVVDQPARDIEVRLVRIDQQDPSPDTERATSWVGSRGLFKVGPLKRGARYAIEATDTKDPTCFDRSVVSVRPPRFDIPHPRCAFPTIVSPETESVIERGSVSLVIERSDSTGALSVEIGVRVIGLDSPFEFPCKPPSGPSGATTWELTDHPRTVICKLDGFQGTRVAIEAWNADAPSCLDRVVVNVADTCPRGWPVILYPESESTMATATFLVALDRIGESTPRPLKAAVSLVGLDSNVASACAAQPTPAAGPGEVSLAGEVQYARCWNAGRRRVAVHAWDIEAPACADRVVVLTAPGNSVAFEPVRFIEAESQPFSPVRLIQSELEPFEPVRLVEREPRPLEPVRLVERELRPFGPVRLIEPAQSLVPFEPVRLIERATATFAPVRLVERAVVPFEPARSIASDAPSQPFEPVRSLGSDAPSTPFEPVRLIARAEREFAPVRDIGATVFGGYLQFDNQTYDFKNGNCKALPVEECKKLADELKKVREHVKFVSTQTLPWPEADGVITVSVASFTSTHHNPILNQELSIMRAFAAGFTLAAAFKNANGKPAELRFHLYAFGEFLGDVGLEKGKLRGRNDAQTATYGVLCGTAPLRMTSNDAQGVAVVRGRAACFQVGDPDEYQRLVTHVVEQIPAFQWDRANDSEQNTNVTVGGTYADSDQGPSASIDELAITQGDKVITLLKGDGEAFIDQLIAGQVQWLATSRDPQSGATDTQPLKPLDTSNLPKQMEIRPHADLALADEQNANRKRVFRTPLVDGTQKLILESDWARPRGENGMHATFDYAGTTYGFVEGTNCAISLAEDQPDCAYKICDTLGSPAERRDCAIELRIAFRWLDCSFKEVNNKGVLKCTLMTLPTTR